MTVFRVQYLSLGWDAYRWLRANLFNSWWNSLLTLVCLWLGWHILSSFLQWAVFDAVWKVAEVKHLSCREGYQADGLSISGACWSVVNDMHHIFLAGNYPYEERWRPYLAIFFILALALMIFIPAIRRRPVYLVAWLIAPFGLVFLLVGGVPWLPLVRTNFWGGLVVTLILTVGGIGFSFPLGVLLALGRRSKTLPVLRTLCVSFIELIRGVPLITILFTANVMLPLFLPERVFIDNLLRAQIGFFLFSSAYVAEVVRAGLQTIPNGQQEAADALGLSYWQSTRLIVLPQALRIVIPPMLGTFIELFKDTSLVVIIGLADLLGAAQQAVGNANWLGKSVEVYVFVAFVYWIMCYGMSRYSKKLEERLATSDNQ